MPLHTPIQSQRKQLTELPPSPPLHWSEQSPVDVALGDVKAVLSTVVPPGWEEANDLCIADLDAEQIRRFPAHAFKVGATFSLTADLRLL